MNITALLLGMLATGAAQAHGHPLEASGLVAGLTHPLLGWEHVLAILAVGLLAAQHNARSAWRLPTIFLAVMLVGALGGASLATILAPQAGIAWSAVALGLLLVFAVRPPVLLSGSVVGVFAGFHGYLHGAALSSGAGALSYGLGFLLATGLLLFAGLWMGQWAKDLQATRLLRIAGGVVAAAGAVAMA
jgi:urease accessory protein